MVNINKLKGKIVENGLTIEKLADNIGIDRSTLYRKINNNGETFTIKEAVTKLKLSRDQKVFLAQFYTSEHSTGIVIPVFGLNSRNGFGFSIA